ncbi:Eukaryotic translation initiation factor 3 subunit H [Borealophlyctis nickersoniae]|nr:Eukaryotic translation initiation factor 3 subunit H [Borealophlyctis nickersoniae]
MTTKSTPPAAAVAQKEPVDNINLDGLDPSLLASKPLHEVQLDALVVLKIVKHCRDYQPVTATGQLLGIDVAGVLEVTNCFPFTSKSQEDQDDGADEMDGAEYQLQMLRCMRKLNFDANTVGWYQSTYLGSFWNQSLIETQFNYQKTFAQSVVIVYDPTRTQQGNLCIRALRLSDTFMELYHNKKFTMDSLIQNKLTPSSIFQSLPVKIRNSHLLSALLHELDEESSLAPVVQASLSLPSSTFTSRIPNDISPLSPNFDNLELSTESYLERHLEYLGETVEEHGQEQWRWQGWHRSLQKEQQKVQQMASKRRAENASRAAQNLPLLYGEDELQPTSPALTKLLATEPSRLETLIITNQIDTYCKQVNQFAGPALSKMFMTKSIRADGAAGATK